MRSEQSTGATAGKAAKGREMDERSMGATHAASKDYGEPGLYAIRIKGHLGSHWAPWFEGLVITLEDNGVTLLEGPLLDQAALHGVMRKVRDLGLPLLSITSITFFHKETDT